MTSTLETLLIQLRDGPVDAPGRADLLARARALLSGDERVPAEVRDVALLDPAEGAEDAAGLLAVLGADDLAEQIADAIRAEIAEPAPVQLPDDLDADDGWAAIGDVLRDGLVAEAASFEIAGAVMRRLPAVDFAWGPVLADAVSREAGAADVADSVLAELDAGVAPLAGAVRAEAGEVDVADRVLAELGLEAPSAVPSAVRDAVRAEAGAVDVVPAVMAAIGAHRSVVEPVVVPAPANQPAGFRRFVWPALAVAAITLVTVSVAEWFGQGAVPPSLRFAQASDVVIEDLSYGENVQVLQIEGDDGAVILWVDEEA